MSDTRFAAGRWIAAALAMLGLAAVFYNVVVDNMPKGEPRNVVAYTPWSAETLRIAETLPVQDGGRIKPLSTYAGFSMLSLHGARSMKIAGKDGEEFRIKPTAWLLDALFRPQFAILQPTFRVDNSAALEAIGVKPRGKRDRYSYEDIAAGREKLGELAMSYQSIDSKERDPIQNQIVALAENLRTYESLLGYFSFARSGIVLRGSGENNAADKRADVSALMTTAPQLREQLGHSRAHGGAIEPRLRDLLEQVLDASNFAKFELFPLPPADEQKSTWQSAGDTIMDVMSGAAKDPEVNIEDIVALETTARSADEEAEFREAFTAFHDRIVQRAKDRGQYGSVELEASYYRRNWFLNAMVFFLVGTLGALGMWAVGKSLAGRVFAWITAGMTVAGLACCAIAITRSETSTTRSSSSGPPRCSFRCSSSG